MFESFINILSYGFFDDKYTLRNNGYDGIDKMSPKQFIFMGSLFILIIIISILLRKVKKEKIFTIYKVLAIIMPILEITKISFETHFDIINDGYFNIGGILPFYTCSMLLYFLPVVAFTNGNLKRYSMAFFTTIGLVAGLSNFVYLSALGWYPLFTFGGMYSAMFHAVIVFVGISLMITGIYTPSFKSIYEGMIPIVIFSIVVIPLNFYIKNHTQDTWVDYMMLMNANGFISPVSDFFINHHIQLLFSLIMLFVAYPIATALIALIDIGIIKFVSLFKKNS